MRRWVPVVAGAVALLTALMVFPFVAVSSFVDGGPEGGAASCPPVAELASSGASSANASDPEWAYFLAAEREQETGSPEGDYGHDSAGCQGAYCWDSTSIWQAMAAEAGANTGAYPMAFDAPSSVQDHVASTMLYAIYQDHGGGQGGYAAAAAAWNGGTTSVVANPALGPGATNYTYANEVLSKMARLLGQPAAPASSSPPDCSTPKLSSGSYANPFRGVTGLVPERIDQGVDYGGDGPIYAIGPGVVDSVYNSGWPDGVFITYELEAGPDQGHEVYVAEGLAPEVKVGQQVDATTVLGTFLPSDPGIEIGLANLSEPGVTRAMAEAQAAKAGDAGAISTGCGQNFNQLLVSLGAPGGVLQDGSQVTTSC